MLDERAPTVAEYHSMYGARMRTLDYMAPMTTSTPWKGCQIVEGHQIWSPRPITRNLKIKEYYVSWRESVGDESLMHSTDQCFSTIILDPDVRRSLGYLYAGCWARSLIVSEQLEMNIKQDTV